MMDLLYSALIAPLEEGMRHALPVLYGITGSWGVAIIALSIGVNFALLPFYLVAEQWQNADRAIQERMRAKMQEIRIAFTGEERFLMTKAYYRQTGYHPLLAVRSIAGVLIQIPVFIATYYALRDFNTVFHTLSGAGFGPISDLSRPDGLPVSCG